MKKIKTILFITIITLLGTSCSKDPANSAGSSSHKVIFKAVASTGSKIDVAVFVINGVATSASGLSGTSWQSAEVAASTGNQISCAVNGIGANASSTLAMQIWIDGALAKELNPASTGTVLVGNISMLVP